MIFWQSGRIFVVVVQILHEVTIIIDGSENNNRILRATNVFNCSIPAFYESWDPPNWVCSRQQNRHTSQKTFQVNLLGVTTLPSIKFGISYLLGILLLTGKNLNYSMYMYLYTRISVGCNYSNFNGALVEQALKSGHMWLDTPCPSRNRKCHDYVSIKWEYWSTM